MKSINQGPVWARVLAVSAANATSARRVYRRRPGRQRGAHKLREVLEFVLVLWLALLFWAFLVSTP